MIAAGTVNANGIETISSLMDIALRDDLISVNPCLGLLLDTDSVERLPYSVVELNLIYSTDIYRSGDRPFGGGGEAAFWIPLVGLFAGARLEEIGQLLNDDIRHAEDIDYFEFTDIDEEAERKEAETPRKV